MNYSHTLASPNDINQIIDLCRALNEEDLDFTGEVHFDKNAVRTALEELVATPSLGRVWLICSDEKPIGYAVLTFGFSLESHGRDGIIDEIYIAPAYRGRGIGTQVMKSVEVEARQLGLKKLYLEVERNNHRAKSLYLKLGFEDFDRHLLNKQLS